MKLNSTMKDGKLLFTLNEMLDVEWLTIEPFDLDVERVEGWLLSSIKNEKLICGDLTIIMCTDDELLEINIEYLKHDFYTDIVTFDYSDGETVSGDLFVSLDRVKENAAVLNQTLERELLRVVVHGVMHLCGYGDKLMDEELLMREKEDFYLNLYKGFT